MPSRAPRPHDLEATQLSPYLILLFVLLSTATLFDGFDSAMMTLAAPDVRASLDIDLEEWGYLFGLCRLGMIASFFFLLFADWIGRRALMMITVVGFAVATGLTALAQDKFQFAACQFFARLFLTAEYALAVIVIGEEYPARWRGRAIAILTSLATLGVVFIAKVQPYVLLDEGAPGNWLHDAGQIGVTWLHAMFGMESDGEGWRVLYFLGVAPLVLILALRFLMRETRRFEAIKASARERTPVGWRQHLRNARIPWQPRYRQRTAIVALLWNCVHLVTAPAIAFWVIYAREELGFSPHLIGDILFWGYLAGATGHFVAGWMIDRVGRKWTCAGFYILASFAIVGLFQTETMFGQYAWHIATVFCFLAAGTATHVYASELFPTEIRATGYGWTTNLFGRLTEVITPLLVGAFVVTLGISWSVTIVAFGPIIGALIVLRYAPETRGMTLEEIDERLSRGSSLESRRSRHAAARVMPAKATSTSSDE
jgi:putative MFS transporter